MLWRITPIGGDGNPRQAIRVEEDGQVRQVIMADVVIPFTPPEERYSEEIRGIDEEFANQGWLLQVGPESYELDDAQIAECPSSGDRAVLLSWLKEHARGPLDFRDFARRTYIEWAHAHLEGYRHPVDAGDRERSLGALDKAVRHYRSALGVLKARTQKELKPVRQLALRVEYPRLRTLFQDEPYDRRIRLAADALGITGVTPRTLRADLKSIRVKT